MTAPQSEENAATLEPVNAMPAPTWHRLHVNETSVDIPTDLEFVHDVDVIECIGADAGAHDAFDQAVAALQDEIDKNKRTPTVSDADAGAVANAEGEAGEASDDADAVGASADASSGGVGTSDASADVLNTTALSAFEKSEIAIESTGRIEDAYRTGMGAVASDWLRGSAGSTQVFATAPEQENARLTVQINAHDKAINTCALDVVAGAHSHLTINIIYSSAGKGTGIVGNTLRIFAGAGAEVDLIVTQALDDGWTILDDTGIVLSEDANLAVRHNVIGATHTLFGLAGDLRGDHAQATVDTRYLGHGSQVLDFNYILTHHGRATESEMNANGVLADKSTKTLRGTIDLVCGGSGAAGHETETVLLADENVTNFTVPVILCSEDDVAGTHGATIGHVRPEQRFYLGCRGLDNTAIEQLFSRAVLEEAYLSADNDVTRTAVSHCAQSLLDDALEDLSA